MSAVRVVESSGSIGSLQVADGSGSIRRVCESCGHIVGYPSSEEIQNFLQK